MKSDNIKISLGTTYYNNPGLLEKFVDNHIDYVDELLIVDDSSTDYNHIYNWFKPSKKMRLFRVQKDYGFNSHGCRNLIMSKAENEFVILLDSDRLLENPEKALGIIRKKKLRFDTIYKFMVNNNEFVKYSHRSVNDFLISKNFFFSVGGYDEEIIGLRNGDRQFIEQLLKIGKETLIEDVKILFSRGPSLKMLESDYLSPFDLKEVPKDIIKLVNKRMIYPDPNKKILTFEWEELT